MSLSVGIVIPTIGTDKMVQCINSVMHQTYNNTNIYVFVDGKEYFEKVNKLLGELDPPDMSKFNATSLSNNVGGNGWYGHRIYAAASFLVNTDIICYLDEDNWIEPDHVERLVEVINKGNDWAYSLRKIYDKEGNYLFEDNCESLGKWPTYCNPNSYHIDTSCFAVKRDVAVKVGHNWYGQWGADRKFFNALRSYSNRFDCSGVYTSCYRLDGNSTSVNKDFFETGNKIYSEKYNNNFPWRK